MARKPRVHFEGALWVCNELEVEPKLIGDRTRKKEIVGARQLIAYIAIQNPDISQKQIADRFNLKPNSISMMLSKDDVRIKFRRELAKILTF